LVDVNRKQKGGRVGTTAGTVNVELPAAMKVGPCLYFLAVMRLSVLKVVNLYFQGLMHLYFREVAHPYFLGTVHSYFLEVVQSVVALSEQAAKQEVEGSSPP
jgi:hypothetical protein